MNKQPMTATAAANSKTNITKASLKIERVLMFLVINGSINRLEAEKAPVFDHALNSTMSNEISQRLHLQFSSIPEKTPGYNGLGAKFHRYTFTAESSARAKILINQYRARRNVSLFHWESAA